MVVFIVISNAIASFRLMYSRISFDWSPMPAKPCNAKFTTTIRSRMDKPGFFGFANPLCIFSVASRIHFSLQNVFPKIMHMLCMTKHVETKLDRFVKCMSDLFMKNRHLPLSMPNARSTHMRMDIWTEFQWYFSHERPSLWPFKGANIQGQHGYTTFSGRRNLVQITLDHKPTNVVIVSHSTPSIRTLQVSNLIVASATITPSLEAHSKVVNKESWKISKTMSLWTSGSMLAITLERKWGDICETLNPNEACGKRKQGCWMSQLSALQALVFKMRPLVYCTPGP